MNKIQRDVYAKQAMAAGAAERRPAVEMISKELSELDRKEVIAQIDAKEKQIGYALRNVTDLQKRKETK